MVGTKYPKNKQTNKQQSIVEETIIQTLKGKRVDTMNFKLWYKITVYTYTKDLINA